MISIKTFTGQPFQNIHVTEDDTTYNDLLKYIKIPPHPRFEEYNRKLDLCKDTSNIYVKPYINFFHITNEVNLKDIIDFDSELTIGFYFEYYCFDWDQEIYEKFGDDFNLPDISTYEKCKTLIEECPFNVMFMRDKIFTYELCKLAVQQDGCVLQCVDCQTEELCKLAVQQYGHSLQWVKDQTEELCRLAVQKYGGALEYVKDQTEEICKLAVQQYGGALKYVKDQTEEICKQAVRQDGMSLRYVKKETLEICKLA